MWSFAIWDRSTRSLFAVEIVSALSLYWSRNADFLYFASEPKQIRAFRYWFLVNIDELSVFFCRCSGFTSSTFFQDIFALSPGHSLTVNADGYMSIDRWYKPNPVDSIDSSFRAFYLIRSTSAYEVTYPLVVVYQVASIVLLSPCWLLQQEVNLVLIYWPVFMLDLVILKLMSLHMHHLLRNQLALICTP